MEEQRLVLGSSAERDERTVENKQQQQQKKNKKEISCPHPFSDTEGKYLVENTDINNSKMKMSLKQWTVGMQKFKK